MATRLGLVERVDSDDSGERRRSPAGRLASAVATVTGNLYLLLGTLFWGSLAVLGGWLPRRGAWVFWMARWWSRGLLLFSGVRLDTSYERPLEPGRRYVFMANHQSLYDIPALLATLPEETRFLAKRSLFRIPVFGQAIRLGGFVSVDRDDRSGAPRSFADAVAGLAAGASVLIFPEGTRSFDGRLLPFERGGFLLALKSGLPVVPVGIAGSLAVRRRGSRRVRPGVVRVRYGGPLETAGYGIRRKQELIDEVRRQIARLAAPAG